MKTIVIALVLVATCASAYACPDYIMSCYASKPKKEMTCVSYERYDGSIVTTCTWN